MAGVGDCVKELVDSFIILSTGKLELSSDMLAIVLSLFIANFITAGLVD